MENVFFILETVFRMTRMPIHYFDKTGNILLFSAGVEKDKDLLEADMLLRKRIFDKMKSDGRPAVDYEDDFLYGVCSDTYANYIVLGPISRSKTDAAGLLAYASRHGLPEKKLQIRHRTLDELCSALSMIHYEFTGEYVRDTDIIFTGNDQEKSEEKRESTFQVYELDYIERETSRLNFADESKYMNLIKAGDVANMKKLAADDVGRYDEYNVGTLAQKKIKQYEYMACSLIVLASRAAIEGGLDSLTAYLMSDLYMQQLEKSMEIPAIMKLSMDVLLDYTERVRQKQEEHSRISFVEQTKNYIGKHLNKRFTVTELAKTLGVDRAYLSKRFSKAEGMGIQKYIRIKRVEAAANMLKFSDESLLTISTYFCFSSQSHFGKAFKDYFGLTPQQYRNKNKLLDF